MAKLDIKQAYRNIPVYLTDRPLLGMSWDGKVYVDKTLPFGLRSAPVIFSAVANALGWIMSKNGVTILFNYLDDFLTLGEPGSDECQLNLMSMLAICNSTGLPVEVDKCQRPGVLGHPVSQARVSVGKLELLHSRIQLLYGWNPSSRLPKPA